MSPTDLKFTGHSGASTMIQYTRFHKILEILSLLFLLASLVIFFLNWSNLPDRVPVHYDLNGTPNRIGSQMELLLVPGVGVFIYLLTSLIRIIPYRFWNTPCKITDANRTFVYSATFSLLQIIKLEVMIFWSFISYFSSTMQAPPNWILFPFGAALITTIAAFYIFVLIKNRRLGK